MEYKVVKSRYKECKNQVIKKNLKSQDKIAKISKCCCFFMWAFRIIFLIYLVTNLIYCYNNNQLRAFDIINTIIIGVLTWVAFAIPYKLYAESLADEFSYRQNEKVVIGDNEIQYIYHDKRAISDNEDTIYTINYADIESLIFDDKTNKITINGDFIVDKKEYTSDGVIIMKNEVHTISIYEIFGINLLGTLRNKTQI